MRETSTQDKISKGTYRKDRHGNKADVLFQQGLPQKPPGLDAEATRLWDFVVANVPAEILSFADQISLEAMCRFWSDYQLGMASTDYKDRCVAMSSWKHCRELMAKYGLTPYDRAKLTVPANTSQRGADVIADLLEKRGAN